MLPLHTERLTVRMLREPDVAALVAYRTDPAIGEFQDWELPYNEDSARRLVDAQADIDGPTNGRWSQLAVALTATGALLGDVFVQLTDTGGAATLGYTFSAEHHGNGYATEAISAVLDALCARGVHRFTATLDPENVASMRVLERTGFTFEALTRSSELIRGEWVDDLRYSLLAEDHAAWVARPTTPPRSVELVEITPDDAYLWGRLRTHHSQERFVAPMAQTFRDALFPEVVDGAPVVPWLRGVLADGERVGFVMLALVTDHHPEPYLWRLLIDRRHQRRGIGGQVLQALAQQVRDWGHTTLATSWVEGPGSPQPFYLAQGFAITGDRIDHEVVGRLTL